MPSPALVPALALIAGCLLGVAAGRLPTAGLIVLVPLVWGLALAAFILRRPLAFLGSIAASFCLSGWTLAAVADHEARHPGLLQAWREGGGTGTPHLLEGALREDAAPWENAIGLSLAVDHAGQEVPGRQAIRGGVSLAVSGGMAADRADHWRAGRRVRLSATLREPTRYRNPGVRDARVAAARRGTILSGGVKSAALVEEVARGSGLEEMAAAVRQRTRDAVGRRVGGRSARSAAIVVAILIGDRVGLDEAVERRLQEAGTYHVIAISGGNIAILAGLGVFILRSLCVGRRVTSLSVIALLCSYAAIVGPEPSVTRATLMAVVYLAARLADFKAGTINGLAAAALLIAAAAPLRACEVGFALTFGATLGILLGVRLAAGNGARATSQQAPARRRLPAREWLVAPVGLLLASVSAELALLPISAWAFSRVTFAGLLLNFAAIPLMTVVQLAGMAVVPLDAAWPTAAGAAGLVAHLGAEGLVRSADLLDLAPWLSYRLPPPHPVALVVYYAAWAAWFVLPPRPRTRVVIALTIAGSLGWILIQPRTLLWPGVSGRLRVAVLDVGHADAILVQLPDRRSLLVDAGGSLTAGAFDIGGRVVAPALWALGTRRLDLLVLSHPHPDHIGGAASVIRDFRPREVWEGIAVPSVGRMADLQAQATRAGARWHTTLAGDAVNLGEVALTVWHPASPDWERQKVRNDDSLVLELRYGDVSLVLPGDIGRDVERDLAARLPPAPFRVLKVPHHGSATSSSDAFLRALRPNLAILSAGPGTVVSAAVLQRYATLGARVFRTDEHGAVILTTDGHTVTVETFRGEKTTMKTIETTRTNGTTKDTMGTKDEP